MRNRSVETPECLFLGTVIQDIRDNEKDLSNSYYIFSGDTYGLFALNNLGQLYLTSSMLNRTSEEYYPLIILVSSLSSNGFCRTNVSIIRTPRWSEFVCPPVSTFQRLSMKHILNRLLFVYRCRLNGWWKKSRLSVP